MKIAFTGAHGTGKSTLVKQLRQHPEFIGYKVFDGIGRYIHVKKKKWSDKRKQRYFNWYYIIRHYLTRKFIASRGLFDTYAYSRLTVNPWYHWWLFNWGFKHIYYDYVFYLPVEFPLEADGVRYGEELQESVDEEIELILDFYHIPYHIITGTVEERYEQVCNILGLELDFTEEMIINRAEVRYDEEDEEAFITITGKADSHGYK